MRKILVLGVLALLPLSSMTYAQTLGEGTGGTAARSNGPTGASGGGHNEPMGFGLLATNSCWPDSTLGCNAVPYRGYVDPAAEPAPAPDATPAAKKLK